MSRSSVPLAALSAMLMAGVRPSHAKSYQIPLAWKPKFTNAELRHIRSLEKKEKTKAVRKLRAKYLAIERDTRNPNDHW